MKTENWGIFRIASQQVDAGSRSISVVAAPGKLGVYHPRRGEGSATPSLLLQNFLLNRNCLGEEVIFLSPKLKNTIIQKRIIRDISISKLYY